MVLRDIKERMMRTYGRCPTMFFLPSDMRYQLDQACHKHVVQTIQQAEGQFISASDAETGVASEGLKKSATGSNEDTLDMALALLRLGEQFERQLPLASQDVSRVAHHEGMTTDVQSDAPATASEEDDHPSALELASTCSPHTHVPTGPTAGIRPNNQPQASKQSKATRPRAPLGKSVRSDPTQFNGSKRLLVAVADLGKKKPKPPVNEFPDLFYIHNIVRYQPYVWSCSRGQRPPDFFKNSLKKHWGAGDFHKEFGSHDLARTAYFRVMDATAARGDDEGLYKARRLALWGTPLEDPIPSCPDHGEHNLYHVSSRVILYPKLPKRDGDAESSEAADEPLSEERDDRENTIPPSSPLRQTVVSPVRITVQPPPHKPTSAPVETSQVVDPHVQISTLAGMIQQLTGQVTQLQRQAAEIPKLQNSVDQIKIEQNFWQTYDPPNDELFPQGQSIGSSSFADMTNATNPTHTDLPSSNDQGHNSWSEFSARGWGHSSAPG